MKISANIFAGLSVVFLSVLFVGCSKTGPGDERASANPSSESQIPDPDALDFQFKWPVGKRYIYRTDMSYEGELGVAGQQIKQEMSQIQEYALSIMAETPDGGCEIEFEFLTLKLDLEFGAPTGPFKMNFDSKASKIQPNRSLNPMLTGFQDILGHKMKLFLSPENEVERIEGRDEIVAKLVSELPQQIAQMLKSMYSAEMINRLVAPPGLPGRPVKPGDTWPVQFDESLGPIGVLMADSQYQFQNQEPHEGRDCAVLVFSGTMRSRPAAEPGMIGGMVKITNGESFGKTWFDPESGRFIDTSVQQSMTINIDPSDMPGGGVEVPAMAMDITQQMSVKLIKEETLSEE